MRVQKSKLKCIKHTFVFNDHSEVIWTPMDQEAKQHQRFRVCFKIRQEAGPRIIAKILQGPASSAASLHELKIVLEDL